MDTQSDQSCLALPSTRSVPLNLMEAEFDSLQSVALTLHLAARLLNGRR